MRNTKYNASLGIDYAFGWTMPEPDRSAFIERYHLQNLSKDLQLSVSARKFMKNGKQTFSFSVKAQNSSSTAYEISHVPVLAGNLLTLRSASGPFRLTFETVQYDMPMPKWKMLQPGATHEVKFEATVVKVADLKKDFQLSASSEIILKTYDVAYDIVIASELFEQEEKARGIHV